MKTMYTYILYNITQNFKANQEFSDHIEMDVIKLNRFKKYPDTQ